MTPEQALEAAVEAGRQSPCQKSKRGVVIFHEKMPHVIASAWNTPPEGFVCSGDETCQKYCGKLCVHAEIAALLKAGPNAAGCDMLHVKVVNGEAVASGPPSCADCSKAIIEAKIVTMYLVHQNSLLGYDARNFHALSLSNNHLPVLLK